MQYAQAPIDSSLGFVEFVPTNDLAYIEANVDGRVLKLQLENAPEVVRRPQGKARINIQAKGNRLTIDIEFPPESRISLPRSEPARATESLPPAARAASASRDEEAAQSSLDETSSSERSQVNAEPAHDLNPSTPQLNKSSTQKSEVPLFEREAIAKQNQQNQETEPVREALSRSSNAPSPVGPPPQQFGAVVDSLAADHEAMAMHRVSEDDARIKGRRQEARIEQAYARHARPSVSGHGIDMAQRRSDVNRRPSIAPDAEGRPSMQSEQLDDVEYTKDEELERLKGFWRKIFHKDKKSSGSMKNVEKA